MGGFFVVIMSKKVFEKIIGVLDKKGVKYKVLKHKLAYTSEQAALLRGAKATVGAKTLVFKADDKFVMMVLAGSARLSSKKFKDATGIKNLRFASPQEIEKKMGGIRIGAIHPFGNIHKIKVYVDKSLGDQKEIAFSPGRHTRSIIMKYQDYIDIVNPIIGVYS